MNKHTAAAIYWVNNPEYSKQHWETVASECMAKADQEIEKAMGLLSESLRAFHLEFQNAVVKPGNVLHEFIAMGLDEVDWVAVADAVFAPRYSLDDSRT